jgi:predicted HAD superfamily Cof-like phosphohydrolase
MDKNIEQVKEFHKLFDIPILSKEESISVERRKLRIALLFEEIKELAEDGYGLKKTFSDMCKKHNIENDNTTDTELLDRVESLDAKGDIAYILYGTALEDGDSTILDTAFNEIHESNMSKACSDLQEALDTIDHYKSKNVDAEYVKKDDKYLIYRISDRKVLKSIKYKEFNGSKFYN